MCAGCVTGVMYCLWYLMDVSDVCCVFMGLTYLFCVGCADCVCFRGRMLLFAMCVPGVLDLLPRTGTTTTLYSGTPQESRH